MIRILYRHRSGTIVEDCPLEQLPAVLKDPQSRVWVDLSSPTDEEYRLVLEEVFHFHPLAIEDAIQDVHVPKVDDYGSYLYLVFHTFGLGDEPMDIESREMDIFLGANYLITGHVYPSRTVDSMWNVDYHRQRGLSRGAAMLLYELLDRQLDNYTPLLEEFEDQVENLGDEIFTSTVRDDNRLLNEILTAKTSALRLRRIMLPAARSAQPSCQRRLRGDSPRRTNLFPRCL